MLAASLPDDWEEGELVVAYEPIWAIGTGNVATAADVAEMHAAIRAALVARYGDRGERIRILYGGSVKADNAAELFAVPDVDGALVGGASLTAADVRPDRRGGRGAVEPRARPIAPETGAANRLFPESPESAAMFTFLLILQTLVATCSSCSS